MTASILTTLLVFFIVVDQTQTGMSLKLCNSYSSYFSAYHVIYAGHEVVVGFTDISGVTTATPGSTVSITVGVIRGQLHHNETIKLILTSGAGTPIGKYVLLQINMKSAGSQCIPFEYT